MPFRRKVARGPAYLPVVLASRFVESGALLAGREAFDLELLAGLAEIYNDTSHINKF